MSKTLGVIKDQPQAIAFVDLDNNVCESVLNLRFYINTSQVMIIDNLSKEFNGTLFNLEDFSKSKEREDRLYTILKKHGNIPCPMCRAKLKIEGDAIYCTNPKPSIPGTTYLSRKPCPFRTDLDHFLKD